jgi:hypothetical protein
VIAGALLVLAIGLGVGLPLAFSGGSAPSGHLGAAFKGGKPAPPLGKPGFEGPPLESGPELAPAGGPEPGASVDGITCAPTEQLLFHIHARLTVFVNGRPWIGDPQAIPLGEHWQIQLEVGKPLVAPVNISSWAGL